MNYTEARNYIDDCYKRGSIYGLEAVTALINKLNNPQKKQRIIHIAGTNGKGSVGTFISQVLINAGYKVGRFVSPTVYCYEERFQINGKYIDDESFANIMTMVSDASDKIDYNPTGFELETAVALCYFNIEKCDVSIIECGLGGKNDATNVINNNLLTVFSSISLDHTGLLGNTVAEIAKEKCGIIKLDTEVVSVEQTDEVNKIIAENCEKLNVKYNFVNKKEIINKSFNGTSQMFSLKPYKDVAITMLGDYQFENAALALKCIDVLKHKGFSISDTALYNGMYSAHWGGRFEIVNTNPLFILDGAHNPDGAVRLKNSLNWYYKNKKMIFIVGVFADKNYDEILKQTLPLAEKVFAITPPSPRGLKAEDLVKAAKKYNNSVEAGELKAAVEYCLTKRDYITVAFGSLSFMGKITEYINDSKEQ